MHNSPQLCQDLDKTYASTCKVNTNVFTNTLKKKRSRRLTTVSFIWVVLAVIVAITHISRFDATFIGTLEISSGTICYKMKTSVFNLHRKHIGVEIEGSSKYRCSASLENVSVALYFSPGPWNFTTYHYLAAAVHIFLHSSLFLVYSQTPESL